MNKGKIELQSLAILNKFQHYKTMPASISGKNHCGESFESHLERVASITRHLCDEFKIINEDRDMLIACAYLHDLGTLIITAPNEMQLEGWRFYHYTNFSRIDCLMPYHGLLSAYTLDQYELDKKEEIKAIVSSHMSHWHPNSPQPRNLYQYIICVADYLSVQNNLFDYQDKKF